MAAPKPELCDVTRDATEAKNILDERPDVAQRLAARVSATRAPSCRRMRRGIGSRFRLAAARALGYVGATHGRSSAARPDPKDRRELAARIAEVTSGEATRAPRFATRSWRSLRDDPGNPQAHVRLGFLLLESGESREAEPHFRMAIAASFPSADPYLGLAECLGARGDVRGAERTLLDAKRVGPGNPVVEANLGLAALAQGRTSNAIDALCGAVDRARACRKRDSIWRVRALGQDVGTKRVARRACCFRSCRRCASARGGRAPGARHRRARASAWGLRPAR